MVLRLARLLAIVSTCVWCAIIPVAPMYRASNIDPPLDLSEIADGAVEHFIVCTHEALTRLEVTHGLQQAHHLVDRRDIGCLEEALMDLRHRARGRRAALTGEQ